MSEREAETRDESRLIALEVARHFANQANVTTEHVVEPNATSVVASEEPWRLVLLAESKREDRLVGVDPIPEPSDPPSPCWSKRPEQHFGHRGIRHGGERSSCSVRAGRDRRTAAEE